MYIYKNLSHTICFFILEVSLVWIKFYSTLGATSFSRKHLENKNPTGMMVYGFWLIFWKD